jgi:hypothetical protein
MWFNRGDVAFYRGDWASAQSHYEQAAALGQQSVGIWDAGYPAFGRGSRGQGKPARERLEAALAICARLGERLYAQRIEQALAGL